MIYAGIYLGLISMVAAVLTVHDKRAARRGARRIKERTLLLVALLGGSVVMLAIMWLIRHKTRHRKFMLGIPAIILLQIAAVAALYLVF